MILNHKHGKVSTECQHPDCRRALSRWKKQWKLDTTRGQHRTVLAEPTTLHIATLQGLDWTLHGIAGTSGVPIATVHRIATGGRKRVLRTTESAILAIEPYSYATKSAGGKLVPTVSSLGTMRRLRALQVIGWSASAIAAHVGRSKSEIQHLRAGNGRRVLLATHLWVARAYRELSARRGPSEVAANDALARGYVGPAEWDDIDHDPESESEDVA